MKFIDESGVIWVMEQEEFYGGVRIRVPECDGDFEDSNENGYYYSDEMECLLDMERIYGPLTRVSEHP
ncbi:MAG: hypothetical protein M0R03_22800 [Novosphingobium sp.]|nr:hypothetical protein [Novosphingobium sp.]